MSIPVISGAAVTAAALLEAAALIEQAGTSGLYVTCYQGRVTLYAGPRTGDARQRAAVVAALGELAGAARCEQRDSSDPGPAAWLEATGQAGSTVIEITTPLAVREVPGGGTLAAGPGGQQAVIAAGQQPPPGWRWVTDLDQDPGEAA
jgi:hypothetical protein